jgi:hypothetical protein
MKPLAREELSFTRMVKLAVNEDLVDHHPIYFSRRKWLWNNPHA